MAVLVHEATPAAEALLDSVLRDGAHCLGEEFPLVFGEHAPGRLITVEEEGRPVAALALLERILQCGSHRLPVGLIGSVATDPAYRGRGLATRALEEAQAVLLRSGAAFALLWADDPQFYAARGWIPVGTEVDYVLSPELVPLLPERGRVRPARSDDATAMHALYCAHETRVERSLAESRSLFAAPGMRTLVLEREGVVCAYACEGRGADLQGVVHEWSGTALDVLTAVRVHLQSRQDPLVLMCPRDARGIARYFGVLGLEARVGILGMGKLLSLEACVPIIESACPDLGVSFRPGELVLEGPGGRACLNEEQTLLLLAAPRGARELAAAVEGLTGCSLSGLPLHPFCWGLDSI